jgi:hypothetical protein
MTTLRYPQTNNGINQKGSAYKQTTIFMGSNGSIVSRAMDFLNKKTMAFICTVIMSKKCTKNKRKNDVLSLLSTRHKAMQCCE